MEYVGIVTVECIVNYGFNRLNIEVGELKVKMINAYSGYLFN
ncbi:MAG: hypothetical protein ACTSPQ_20315 [Candidatus Helarchaeota archaeon]